MKVLPCLLIAVGAFASIATSKVYSWNTSADGNLPPLVLDNQTTTVRYLIHVDLNGPQPFTDFGATLEVNVFVQARTPASASTTLEVHSLTHPDQAPTMMTTDVTSTYSHYLGIDALLDCTADPCGEDYEVVVQRDPTADLPPIDIKGPVSLVAWANKAPPEASVDVTVTVEP